MSARAPLVSVVVPAYKQRFLQQALDSVLQQTWPNLELVVCDDSADGAIQALVEAFAGQAPFPVNYSRNPRRLGEVGSMTRGVQLAQGAYIKFLHDDDELEPECVSSLVQAMESSPSVVLASSRRQRIGEFGRYLPDLAATLFPFNRDVRIDGPGLVSFLADHTLNFIGEPSCVLCRRQDLLELEEGMMHLGGAPIRWVGDLALYAKLLRKGDLALLAQPLTCFRVWSQQFSQAGRTDTQAGDAGHQTFRDAVRRLGWYQHTPETAGQVAIAPLDGSVAAAPVDLRQLLDNARSLSGPRWRLHEWQAQRRIAAALWDPINQRLSPKARSARLGIVILPGPSRLRDLQRTALKLAIPARLASRIECTTLGVPLPAKRDHLLPLRSAPAQAVEQGDMDAAIAGWDVDWVLAVEAGTEFSPSGLALLLLALDQADPSTQAVYCDEWHRTPAGELVPVMRPDHNPEFVLANPRLMTGHWVVRRQAGIDAGGFGRIRDASQAGLALRLLARGGTGSILHLAEPLLTCLPPQVETAALGEAVTRHLRSSGYPQAQAHDTGLGTLRIDYAHAVPASVSVIVVAGADTRPEDLERCVVSVLEYAGKLPLEILLFENGCAPETRHWIEQAEAVAEGRIRSFRLDPPVPHPAANTIGASQAQGDYLLFLRPQVNALHEGWLEELLNHAQLPHVGVVGAKTVDAQARITHAGCVPGLFAAGGHVLAGQPADAPGYMDRLQAAQRMAAVSDACMLVGKDVFADLGGFDSVQFPDEGADLDLCLRAGQAGLACVMTPHALLLNPTMPGPFAPETGDALLRRWLPSMAADRTYSPNLRTDVAPGYALAESDFSWRAPAVPALRRILAHPSDQTGSGQYRIIQPLEVLKATARVDGSCYRQVLDPVQVERIDPDVIVFQRKIGAQTLSRIDRIRSFNRAYRVYELDDFLPGLPAKSIHRSHMPKDIAASLRQSLQRMDRLVVATPALAEAYSSYHDNIVVVPNRLSHPQWGALPAAGARKPGSRPRVGWAGGLSHTGDLEMVADVVRELSKEVDWVFFGMCPERLRPYVAEFHEGIPFQSYPRRLAQLGLDLAIAPLEDNRFNRCKSNLRLLEYGACGYPVVASDLEPYRGDLPVTRVRNRYKDWVAAIRQHLADPAASLAAGRALKAAVHKDWMLRGPALDDWLRAWAPD
jgi:GT2 family glycosyltransferase